MTDQELQRYRDPSWFVEGAEIMRMAYEAHRRNVDRDLGDRVPMTSTRLCRGRA